MVVIYFLKLIILSKTFASNIINYKFGSNFGQVFYDYSGSGNHATNGYYIYSDYYDTYSSDRGAYFQYQDRLIRLPPNDLVTNQLNLNSGFSILMWFYSFELYYDYYITWRFKNDWSTCFGLTRTYYNYYNSFYASLCQNPHYSWVNYSPLNDIIKPGKF